MSYPRLFPNPYSPQQNTRSNEHWQPYRNNNDFDPYYSSYPPESYSYDQGPTYQEKDSFPLVTNVRPRGASGLRKWRKEHYDASWTSGSRGRCIGRFFCCILFSILFFLPSLVFTLLLWIRPPDVQVNTVAAPMGGSAINASVSGINVQLGVNISINNPNYFSIDLSKIKAGLTYPINDFDIGGGEKDDTIFKSNTKTTFVFPLMLMYNPANDPDRAVLQDLLKRCGIVGGQKENLDIKYTITLGVKVLFTTISPSINGQFSFPCPLGTDALQSFGGGLGI